MKQFNSSKEVTICIPTYNRSITVLNRLDWYCQSDLLGIIRLLVSDNTSTDGTYEQIQKYGNTEGISIVQNSTHGSHFFGNIANLFYQSDTEWLIYYSDEDSPVISGIESFCSSLSNSSSAYDVVVASVIPSDDGSLTAPVRSIKKHDLTYKDIYGMRYISGVAINKRRMGRIFDLMLKHHEKNAFIHWFPHTALILSAFARKGLLGLPDALAKREEKAKGYFPGEDNKVYYKFLDARWKIWAGAQDWFRLLKSESAVYECDPQLIDDILLQHTKRVLVDISQGLSYERPEYSKYFDAALKAECGRMLSKEPWPDL